ncbi:MAG: hypothetical protein K2Z81_19115 [Cyanobacteria bacterium]|nr:hypothetical protein [Cyanobacteriota bacterium]
MQIHNVLAISLLCGCSVQCLAMTIRAWFKMARATRTNDHRLLSDGKYLHHWAARMLIPGLLLVRFIPDAWLHVLAIPVAVWIVCEVVILTRYYVFPKR